MDFRLKLGAFGLACEYAKPDKKHVIRASPAISRVVLTKILLRFKLAAERFHYYNILKCKLFPMVARLPKETHEPAFSPHFQTVGIERTGHWSESNWGSAAVKEMSAAA
jgi:hypothetical protein